MGQKFIISGGKTTKLTETSIEKFLEKFAKFAEEKITRDEKGRFSSGGVSGESNKEPKEKIKTDLTHEDIMNIEINNEGEVTTVKDMLEKLPMEEALAIEVSHEGGTSTVGELLEAAKANESENPEKSKSEYFKEDMHGTNDAGYVTLPNRLPAGDVKYLSTVNYGRKVDSWKDAPSTRNSEHLKTITDKLTVINHQDLYGKGTSQPSMDKFKVSTPQHFVMHRSNDERYLINTEGYDYARYVARLK